MSLRKITFFSRFEEDIVSGKKNITIRDRAESYFEIGETLEVFTNETDRYFATITIVNKTQVTLDELNEKHAEQENMSLEVLKKLIKEIYPTEDDFFVYEFKLV